MANTKESNLDVDGGDLDLDPKDQQIIFEIGCEITKLTGIIFNKKHLSLIKNRLSKRVRDLKFSSFTEYGDYLKKNRKIETSHLISLLTTNHTFFFREFEHFAFIRDCSLPVVIAAVRAQGRKKIRIWSAACSYGQEVYSLAMFLDYHLKHLAPDMDYEILGTDISESALEKAEEGVFKWADLKKTPALYLSNHWIRNSNQSDQDAVTASRHLRSKCDFELVNLQTLSAESSKAKFDYIFCRNVFIYFSPENIAEITRKLTARLEPHGLFLVGLSESLQGLNVPLDRIGKSIYVRSNVAAKAQLTPLVVKSDHEKQTSPVRVLCVDDSGTVLQLLQKILVPKSGFEVVGTATDGLQAAEFLKTNKVDVITLDIHMPNQNGVEFLESQRSNKDLPAVVIVSSVSRDDATLAVKALDLGASDYVEKPTLKNFPLKADEIQSKVHAAYQAKKASVTIDHRIESHNRARIQISKPETKLRILLGKPGDRQKLSWVLGQLKMPQPATMVLIEGLANLDQAFQQMLKESAHMPISLIDAESKGFDANKIYLGPLDESIYARIREKSYPMVCQILVGSLARASEKCMMSIAGSNLLGDEQAVKNSVAGFINYEKDFNDVAPYTSLAYESEKYFEGIRDSTEIERQALQQLNQFVSGKSGDAPLANQTLAGTLPPSRPPEFFRIQINQVLVCFYEPLSKVTLPVMFTVHSQDQLIKEVNASLAKFTSLSNLRSGTLEVKIIRGKGTSGPHIEKALAEKAKIKGHFYGNTNEIEAYVYADTGRIRVSNVTPALNSAASLGLSSRMEKPAPSSPAARSSLGVVPQKIKVLVVDDSEPIRILLKKILKSNPRIDVVAEASRPSQVEELIKTHKPDVMTLDIHMPEMTGTQLLSLIYPRYRIPTIIVTSLSAEEGNDVLRALEIGAFDYIQKPSFEKINEVAAILCEKVMVASQQSKQRSRTVGTKGSYLLDIRRPIFIGSSTGGVEALKVLIETLPKEIPPILIAQHIPAFFSKAFADRLNQVFSYEVKEAEDGELLTKNKILIAPGSRQMQVSNKGGHLMVKVEDGPRQLIHKPSVDVLFESAAREVGKRAVGIILTGMGADGSKGLLRMRSVGCFTVGQNEESCIVYGMPKAAKTIGAVCEEVSLEKIIAVVAEAENQEGSKDRGAA